MSFLTVDKNQAGGFGPIEPGKYELVISKVEKTTAKASGNPMLKLELTIRSNVEQAFQKRKLFDNLVVTEKAMFKFHNLGMAIFGADITFGTIDEFAKAIKNQYVRAQIKTERGIHNGQETVNDRIVTFMPTEFPGGEGDVPNPFDDDDNEQPVISDDDLPF